MALAEKRFILEGNVEGFDMRFDITVELTESGAFQYGNGHAVVIKYNEGRYEPELWDSRYDKRFNTVESFNKHVYEFLRETRHPGLTITEVA